MLFTTFPQLLALLVLFVAGVIIGLGLHPGGGKWKRRFKDESDNYAAFRREADKAQREANRRIGVLEDEVAAANAKPATSAAPETVPIAANAPVAAFAPSEPDPEPAKTGAIMDNRDLSRIRGIDPTLKTKLFALGVTEFSDIEQLSAEDEMALEQRLAVPVGYITREQWRDQALLLRTGQDAEHAARFPPR